MNVWIESRSSSSKYSMCSFCNFMPEFEFIRGSLASSIPYTRLMTKGFSNWKNQQLI
jgi:hypothetical protein